MIVFMGIVECDFFFVEGMTLQKIVTMSFCVLRLVEMKHDVPDE